ncbi:hypothetical protein FRACYDRAFT_250326 [Fragilariopsis cylindrus CCMP1102]|uniref:Uncharacterized protein n=1 Tax=Fragilariopsis cylindrus CCMP1102 TaxID=635003 RepID=A0A1E7ERD5_9STRA|nr:hypothetical protein FRACYDRAFT_250326 [Fragilariopsis cylindrus CCMP1102]|eukprot:OEU08103.1 hypothetical protein FRACYDRAFT_250326 [Fragilariopsis cylindrus CCMP1102]
MDDDNNIDIEDVQQAQAQAAQDEQQQQQQAVVLLKKMILVLEQKETFPLQTRNKTDELVENFIENLEDDVHEMLCFNSTDSDSDNYRGLDSDRDTDAEVEAIVRVFPEVLTRRKEDDEDEYGPYPIQLLAFPRYEDSDGKYQCNVKTVLFIPVVARIAIELGLFEEEERGGLLFDDDNGGNVLHQLMFTDQTIEGDNREQQHEAVDDKFLQVLIQLRKLGLLKKEDIERYSLLHYLCGEEYFAEKRFRFMVEWDPSALTQTNEYGQLPIRCAFSSIQGFRSVFEAGIHYYPKKKGISLLFRKSNKYSIPFVKACMKYGKEQVMKTIKDTFVRCYSSSDDTPPLNVVDALMTAAIDKDIHLDGVYFLLRRQPDILQKLLSSASINTAIDPNPMVVFNSNNNGISPKKKRKRKDTNIGDDDDGGTF